MQSKPVSESPSDVKKDVREIGNLTPFTTTDLQGERFARGNMLGGASPLGSATPPPWKKDKATQ